MLRLFRLMRLRQCGDGKSEAENDRDGQHEINQDLQKRNELNQPHAARAREQHVRQQPVANNNDKDETDDGLNSFRPGPMRVSKDEIADNEGDRSRGELREDGKSKSCALAGAKQARLDQLFKGFNVFLKFTAQEFAALSVKTLNVGDEHKKRAKQKHYRI